MGTRDSKGEPVPYTAPSYDPDNSGRPPADVASKGAVATPSSDAAGEQTAPDKEPQPYVDPAHEPGRG